MNTNSALMMKRLTLALSVLTLFTLPLRAAEPARPSEVLVGLSPFYTLDQRVAASEALVRLILQGLPRATQVSVWDAWNLTSVVTFTVPSEAKLKYDSPQARVQQREIALALGGLKRWFDANTNAPVLRELSHTAALKIPEWLQEASGATAVGAQRVYVLVGSPLYRSPAEPTFDMAEDARYPSDGHLALGLRDSVFGVAEKAGRLDRATVHWCYLDQSVWANELHRHSVTRFWSLFVKGQGGTLATFGADLAATFTRATQTNLPPVLRAEVEPADDKPVMRSARPRTLPAWLEQISKPSAITPDPPPAPRAPVTTPAEVEPAPVEPTPTAATEKPDSTPELLPIAQPPALPPDPAPAAEPVKPAAAADEGAAPPPVPPQSPEPTVTSLFPTPASAEATGIGIAWAARGVDLDLYVRAHARAQELYFRQNVTREGRYYHDYRNANLGIDYEYVELRPGVDLRQTSVWVNYYVGRVPNVAGKVCIHHGGKTVVRDFVMKAPHGNRAGHGQRRGESPYWTEVKLTEILGLGDQP